MNSSLWKEKQWFNQGVITSVAICMWCIWSSQWPST